MHGLGAHYELDVRCRAAVDPVTGYSLNIKDIDAAARATIIPAIARAFVSRFAGGGALPADVLRESLPALNAALSGRLDAVTWRLSPFYAVEMAAASSNRAILRQQFEFAASHRLHVPGLSDEANRDRFGKCNNPSGHGHNYRVEPAVEVPVGSNQPFTLLDLESITKRTIIDRFDHTNLSVDRPEFIPPTGLNPSVENIAKVCFDLLSPAIAAAGHGATLRAITVWETDKTSCTYPA